MKNRNTVLVAAVFGVMILELLGCRADTMDGPPPNSTTMESGDPASAGASEGVDIAGLQLDAFSALLVDDLHILDSPSILDTACLDLDYSRALTDTAREYFLRVEADDDHITRIEAITGVSRALPWNRYEILVSRGQAFSWCEINDKIAAVIGR